ncbi:hypothetical protein GF318_03925 [Candidatus Micrarchaeota archaeon]|nr:hypothetical protein [Candidatus Micrarchaeota archaeon]
MPPKKKRKKSAPKKSTKTARQKEVENPHLPGYLLIAFGMLTLPLNFGLLPGLEWMKAWPLLLVLFGVAHITKEMIAKGNF